MCMYTFASLVLDKKSHYIVHIPFWSDISTIDMNCKGMCCNNVCSGSWVVHD